MGLAPAEFWEQYAREGSAVCHVPVTLRSPFMGS
jgi:hypothetical protein